MRRHGSARFPEHRGGGAGKCNHENTKPRKRNAFRVFVVAFAFVVIALLQRQGLVSAFEQSAPTVGQIPTPANARHATIQRLRLARTLT
jgi:hypothetical protein